MKKLILLGALAALIMAGCAPTTGPREGVGTLLGAATGAIIGAQFGGGDGRLVATALGSLAGGLIGQDIGRTLDRVDREYMEKTAQQSLEEIPSNQSSTWVNPDTGNSGRVTPTRTYQDDSGRYCREYQQSVVINGEEQQADGTACRQPDGNWQIISRAAEVPAKVVQQKTVTRYVVPDSPPAYYPGYPWPLTSLSLSFGHYSGHRHSGHRSHWRSHWRGHNHYWDD